MNKEDIIKLAREACDQAPREDWNSTAWVFGDETLERFAALVAAAARAEENEACAKVCERLGVHPALNIFNGGPDWYKHGKDCAAAIRARGEK